MTVVIALKCVDGVVIGSDSQGTEAGGTRQSVQKVFPLGTRAAWGGSGGGQVIRDLVPFLATNSKYVENAAFEDVHIQLGKLVKQVLKKHYYLYIAAPNVQTPGPATTVLAVGLQSSGTPWIVEIDQTCSASSYTEKGFHAIGSGGAMALLAESLLSHYEIPKRSVDDGKLLAYRALNAVIQTSLRGRSDSALDSDDGCRRATSRQR